MFENFKLSKTVLTALALATFIFLGSQAQACDTCDAHADKKADKKEDCSSCKTECEDVDKAHHEEMKSGSHNSHGKMHGAVDADGKAKGATMGTIFHAEHLYACPMHPEVITDNGEAKCPLCNMNLAQLNKKEVHALLISDPKGCPMDPIVMYGHKTDNCSICKMNLRDIKKS